MNPIVPWIGGKRRLVEKLLPLFPQHECYVEPFAGGAALLFNKPPSSVEVLNDVNGELINLYRVVKNHLEEFVRQFKWALSSRQVYEWMQGTLPETLTDIQRAARFYYLQTLSFGGKVSGQSFGTATTTVPGLNLLRIEEELSAAHLRLARVWIEHDNWRRCIERYDREHTLFYADPPYWQTEGYGVPFPIGEYEELARLMGELKGKAIVSLGDHPEMRRIFGHFQIESCQIGYSVGNNHGSEARRTELVVFSWDREKEPQGGLF